MFNFIIMRILLSIISTISASEGLLRNSWKYGSFNKTKPEIPYHQVLNLFYLNHKIDSN